MPTHALPKSAGVLALEALRKGLDQQRDIVFPGQPEFPITLIPLSVSDLQVAQARAEHRFRSVGLELNILNADDFASELHIQVLALSMRVAGKRDVLLFADADELRDQITADERTALTTEYIDLQSEANPVPEAVDDELFEQIEDAIKKKDREKLSSIGSRTLSTYMLSSASQQES